MTSDARGARESAYRALARTEPVMARLAGAYGRPDPFEWFDGGRTGTSKFAAMILHITGQRISAAAAFTIYDRITAASGAPPDASSLLTLGPARLRAVGLSDAKTRCLLELAGRQEAGLIDLESMSAHTDDEVTSALVAIPGIGLWSAQAFLLRQLHRPDVLPATDTGIRRAIGREWNLPRPPTRHQVGTMAAAWAPYRSYAAALLWRSLRPPGEPSDPKARALARALARASRAQAAATPRRAPADPR